MNYEDRVTKEYVENALAGAGPRIVVGSYVGSGAATRTISLGFTPRAVYVCRRDGLTVYPTSSGDECWGGFALTSLPSKTSNGNYTILEITATGFTVYHDGAVAGLGGKGLFANQSGKAYSYLAIG